MSQLYIEKLITKEGLTQTITSPESTVSKQYVDTHLEGYLPISGGEVSGNINLNFNNIINSKMPTDKNDLATKEYVDLKGGSSDNTTTDNIMAIDTVLEGGSNQYEINKELVKQNSSLASSIDDIHLYMNNNDQKVSVLTSSVSNNTQLINAAIVEIDNNKKKCYF